jgi:hypothetical protein
MNTNKFYDFFKPDLVTERIHIIGCGAVGSLVGETLARMGLTKITLYDFDTVEPHNIANQIFTEADLGKPKVTALSQRMLAINPDMEADLRVQPVGYQAQRLSGYVFLCVDSIDLRRKIATEYKGNPFIKAMFDFRMRLTDAQHFAADWADEKAVTSFLNSMQFTSAEAKEQTPVSACNLTLSVIPTVWTVVSLGVANFMNFAQGKGYKCIIYSDPFAASVEAY